MELLNPSFGLIIWMLIAFCTLLFVLGKFAWKPIVNAVKNREENIKRALEDAKKAEEQLKNVQAETEKLMVEARKEREDILKTARETKNNMIEEAKSKAGEEAEKVITKARASIESERLRAVADLRTQVASLSLEVAEKILKEQMKDEDKQKTIINNVLKDVSLN